MRAKFLTIISLFTAMTAGAQSLTLTVDDCRQRALASDEEILKSDYDLQESENDLAIAKRSFLPKVDGAALLEYITPDFEFSGMEIQMRGLYIAGLSITQPIYTGGKLTAGKKLAGIGVEAARQKQRMSRAEVIANADNAYWTLAAVDGKVDMLRSYVAQMDSLYAQTQRAVNVGMTTANDLLRIEARRSEIQYNLKKALNGRDLCRLALCRVIGADFSTDIVLADTDLSISDPGLLDNDISARPELELLNLAIDANKQQVKMAKADYLPTVGLSLGYFRYGGIKTIAPYQSADGSYSTYSNTTNDGMGMAMLSVSIPIFNWGITGKKVGKSKMELAKSQLDLNRNQRLLTLEAQQAINNVNDGYELVKSAEIALQQAEQNLASVKARYKVAMCPIIDLLDAQSQWNQSKSNLLEARAQYKIYRTEYLRTVGKLDTL